MVYAGEAVHLDQAGCREPPNTHLVYAGEAVHQDQADCRAPQRTHSPCATGEEAPRSLEAAGDPWVEVPDQVGAGSLAGVGAAARTTAVGTAHCCYRVAGDGVAGEVLSAAGNMASSEVADAGSYQEAHRCGMGSDYGPCYSYLGEAVSRAGLHEGEDFGIAGEGTDCCCTLEVVIDSYDSPFLIKILFSVCTFSNYNSKVT